MGGQLLFHFASAILLTALVSGVVVTWYRHAVTRSMRIAGSAASEVDPGFERELAAGWRHVPGRQPDRPADGTATAESQLRQRAAVVYGLGSLAASAVMTTLYLVALGDAVTPLRTFTLFYVFCWPIVPTLSFMLGLSRGRGLLLLAAYIGIGMLMVATVSAVVAFSWTDAAAAFLQFLVVQASLPFLIILATSGARIRSVAPLVLAGLLVFSFSNLAAGSALIALLDVGAVRDTLLTLGAFGGYNAWYLFDLFAELVVENTGQTLLSAALLDNNGHVLALVYLHERIFGAVRYADQCDDAADGHGHADDRERRSHSAADDVL